MTAEASGCCCCKAIIGILLATIAYVVYKYFMKRPRKSPLKEDYKEGMVYLYQFDRVKGIPNLSPFCLKLETWLRMAKIEYEIPKCGFMPRSCEGTVPFLEYNGQEYPDSSFAIRDMTAIFEKESMEEHLTSDQRATGRAFETMAEYSLVTILAIFRFSEYADKFCPIIASLISKTFAPVIIPIGKYCIAPCILKRLKSSFVGKHSTAEMLNIAREDLRAISAHLGRQKFFFGDKPTRVDATLFGVLAQIVYSPFEIPQKQFVAEELPNLKEYCERMKEQFWPDWDEITKA